MFSKVEASQLRTAFWTAFGQYMVPVKGTEDEKVNWINYKTGEKDIFFRMRAEAGETLISIELTHKDDGLRQIYFEQFIGIKNLLHEATGEEWTWQPDVTLDGKKVSRIYKRLPNATIFKKEDWPQIISFFKQRMMALDVFWSSARYSFELLR